MPPTEILYSRPSRIRKAPDRLNLSSHTLLHATAQKAMKDLQWSIHHTKKRLPKRVFFFGMVLPKKGYLRG